MKSLFTLLALAFILSISTFASEEPKKTEAVAQAATETIENTTTGETTAEEDEDSCD